MTAPPPPPARGGGAVVTAAFSAATFLGAFLLFLVQPLIAKYILPWFGGGAAVWTTCLLFFQAILLAGYLYAHVGVSRLGPRGQALVHVAVLLAAAASALPAIVPSARWQPPAESAGADPTWRILMLLGATVGLPCVALAATSPLLHAWYARIRPGAPVYRLYALSNAGSLLALLAYPFVVEPLLPRRGQALAWSIGMSGFAVLCATCAALAARYAAGGPAPAAAPDAPRGAVPHAAPVRGSHVLFWIALPACAAALLLGTTNTITQEVAPVPLLWVLPLAIYLLTFVIAFDHPRWYRRGPWGWLLVIGVGVSVVLLSRSGDVGSIALIVGGLCATLLAGCMVLHGELARLRPPPDRLTAYYLAIAAGGAAGGLLVAVGAPLLLRTYAELPMAIWACCALGFVAAHAAERRMPAGVAGMLGIAGITALGAFLWVASSKPEPGASFVARSRDFYGVLSVWQGDEGAGRGAILRHGAILHGHQYLDPAALRATPTTYFYPESGIGRVLGEGSPLPRPRRVGVVGLGTGTIAAYAGAGDAYRFYEISPGVLRYAREYFTYLADAAARGATADVILGDGRLSLEREPDQRLDVLALDAFSGDAIPVHLLTGEAFDLYRRHLAPGGVIGVHVSNKHVDLVPVVAAAARRLGWPAVRVPSQRGADPMTFPAEWVVLGPDAGRIDALLRAAGGQPLAGHAPEFVPWTDERADILGVIR